MLGTLIVTLLIALAVLASPAAYAKGWSGPWYYLPGETWGAHTEVKFGSTNALRKAMKTEYFAYMIEATRAPVEPDDLRLGRVVLRRHPHEKLSLRAEVRFEIPDIPMGRYVVTFCTLGCRDALGRIAPVFRILVVRNEAQRALFYWLDDWLQVRRNHDFFSEELGRLDWMADSARTTHGLQDWGLKSLIQRVDDLESREGAEELPAGAPLALGVAGGVLGWVGAGVIARSRRRRWGEGTAAGSRVPRPR